MTPVAALILPVAGALLLQVPPDVRSAKVVVDPTQTFGVPEMATGVGLTVILKVT